MARIGPRIERRDAVAWLTLPPEMRLLAPEHVEALGETLAGLADDPGVRVAVLAGSDGTFCDGWDPAALKRSLVDTHGLRRLGAAFQSIADTPLPLIAAVNGDALDAGLELALVCDIRIAAAGVRFGFPASRDGLLPLGGGVARLTHLAGRTAATRLLLMGDLMRAEEALTGGLVSAVRPSDGLTAEAERIAHLIAARGPIAVRYAKEVIARGMEMPLDQALRAETDLTIILQATADRAEGVRAFAEKREPEFRGE
jgi:enoyl-CoA hydratase/carnithine racemase